MVSSMIADFTTLVDDGPPIDAETQDAGLQGLWDSLSCYGLLLEDLGLGMILPTTEVLDQPSNSNTDTTHYIRNPTGSGPDNWFDSVAMVSESSSSDSIGSVARDVLWFGQCASENSDAAAPETPGVLDPALLGGQQSQRFDTCAPMYERDRSNGQCSMYLDEDSEVGDFHGHQSGGLGRECDNAGSYVSLGKNQHADAYAAEENGVLAINTKRGTDMQGDYDSGRDTFSNSNSGDTSSYDESSCKASIDFSQCERNETRGPDDLYTPRWIRGIGKEKEGLCPMCYREGKIGWKRLKCSAYWYHLNYFHGISSLSGRAYPKPVARRTSQDQRGRSRKQGLCPVCRKWVLVDSSRKVKINVPEIYWWKHIQACTKKI